VHSLLPYENTYAQGKKNLQAKLTNSTWRLIIGKSYMGSRILTLVWFCFALNRKCMVQSVKRVVFYVFNLLNQTLKGKNIQVKKANKKRMLHLVPLAAKDKWLLCKRLMSTLSKISVSFDTAC